MKDVIYEVIDILMDSEAYAKQEINVIEAVEALAELAESLT